MKDSSNNDKVEKEIRGKLDRKEFNRLKKFLNEKGTSLEQYKRLTVDLSPGFDVEKRTWDDSSSIDLRVKKSDKREKISLKVGQLHSKERSEIEVDLKEGGFLKAVRLLELLGYDSGMIYFWETWDYQYEGCEVSVTKFTKDHFMWEIEAKKDNASPSVLAKSLDLKPYTKSEYHKSMAWENRNIHKIFSFKRLEAMLERI